MTTPAEPPSIPPQMSADQAVHQAEVTQTDELRAFVSELIKQTQLGFDPGTVVKGIVTAISANTTPPTLTINISGDTTVPVAGVRYIDSYSPTVGDTILAVKQGPVLFVLGKIASVGTLGNGGGSGWTQATLASGFTHNGDSQGNVEYRKVWDNGSWKMQWRGCAARSANTTVISALGTDFRPAVKRKVITARGFGGGSVAIQLVFDTDGSVTTDGGTAAHSGANGLGSTNLQNIGAFPTTTYTALSSHTDHRHTVDGTGTGIEHWHAIDIPEPDWVSFHNVEYFL